MFNRARNVLAGLVFLATGAASHAALLTNGSFEADNASASPFFIRYNTTQTLTGWTWFADGVDLIHDNYTQGPAVLVDPQDGAQFLDMNSTGQYGGIYQDVSVTPGETYKLSLWASRWATNSAGGVKYALLNALDNALISTGTIDITATSGWQNATLEGTATSNLLRVQLEAVGGVFQAGPGLDNVSLVAVPEPSSAALLGATALGLLTRARRSKRQSLARRNLPALI